MKVEFFHDVICSFCFPMSARMHEIQAEIPELDIIHRSFALAWDDAAFTTMFGSRSRAKTEVLTHWQAANQNDAQQRFNIEGMAKANFNFPTSKNALVAAKAAGLVAGQAVYWEVFDRLQTGLFVENVDIEQDEIIEALVLQTSIDFNAWKTAYNDPNTLDEVLKDLERANTYNLRGVPALIINGKYLISGAQPYDTIVNTLKEIIAEEQAIPLEDLTENNNNASCNFVDGKWVCN
ncbi:MAG: DsbA family protein [Erysipelothrix sp.]|nr:DsbA family protein [Erysipelothrix sp.]